MPVGDRVVPVGTSEQRHVCHWVTAWLDAVEELLQAPEPIVDDLTDQPSHAAEVRVHGHRGRSRLGGDATGGQSTRPRFGDQFRRDIDQRGAITRVTLSWAHLAIMA
jgi:hypothetical protein